MTKKKTDAPFAVPNWSAAKSTLWKLEKIKPYENNPRTHPPEQIALLADHMKTHGPDQPIVVDEKGVILKGHGRLMAARQAGFEEFPVAQHIGLTDEAKKAIRIADNQIALLSGWNEPALKFEISELKGAGFELGSLGFSEKQLAKWMGTPEQAPADPDHIPDPPKKTFLRAGDVVEMGEHRMAVGDSTKRDLWTVLLGGKLASMVFTDPPYGVSYQAQSGKYGVIEGDHKRRDDLYKMLVGSLREMANHSADGAGMYIWHATSTREDFTEAMKAVGLAERQYLIWVKPSIVMGHSDYSWQHEPCFYASAADKAPKFYGERSESTVWRVQTSSANDTAVTVGTGVLVLDGEGATLFVQSKAPKAKKLRQVRIAKGKSVILSGADRQDGTVWEVSRDGNHQHPTQKPVELARRAIENSSRKGEIVLDGFLGSGTTLIAAEMTGRRCFGAEIDPIYAERIVQRWEKFSGGKATIDGKPLSVIERQRGGKNAASNSRKPISRKDGGGDGKKRPVREAGHARLAEPG